MIKRRLRDVRNLGLGGFIVTSNTIDAKMLSKMFLAGAKNLESKKEWINELNVFPVPDGDTGTNLSLIHI